MSDAREQKYRDLRAIAEDERNRTKREGGRAQLYALEIPTSVIIGAVLGKLADDSFHIEPIGITVGLLAGIGAAVRAMVRMIAWHKGLSASDPPVAPVDDSAAPDETRTGGDSDRPA